MLRKNAPSRRARQVRSRRHRALLESLEPRFLLAGDLLSDGQLPGGSPEPPALVAAAQAPGAESEELAEGESDMAIDLVALAKAIAASGAQFFGADWCPACRDQKALFEDGADFLPFVEATNPDQSLNDVGNANDVTALPTWVFDDETRVTGVQDVETLARLAGVEIPMSNTPSFAPIGDLQITENSPLNLAIDAYDPNGDPLTITVTTSNANVDARTLDGNRSIRFSVGTFGDLVFQAFEQRAPVPAGRVISLAGSGFYNGLTFHRVAPGFVIQGGDPAGNGTGSSSLPDFDDQFDPELQHNQVGVLSFAKGPDDTNNSQFFVTLNPTTPLDFNHSVFGQLVEGETVLRGIERVPVADPDGDGEVSTPIDPVTINSAEVFTDTENGVVVLSPQALGASSVTVTVTDGDGNSFSETFTVTVVPELQDDPAYLEPIPTISTTVGVPAVFTLQAVDVNNETTNTFTANLVSGPQGTSVQVNPQTGEVTVTPPAGYEGLIRLDVAVEDVNANSALQEVREDRQRVVVSVVDFTPTDDLVNFDEDSVDAIIPVLANDGANDLTIVSVGQTSAGGNVQIAGSSLLYTPAPNFFGEETFTYNVSDGEGVAVARVVVQVQPVNDDPTGVNDDLVNEDAVAEDSANNILDVLANDITQPDIGESLSIVAVSPTSQGGTVDITPNGLFLSYTPPANFSGQDTFTYTLFDGESTDTADVTITVTAENDPPNAVNDQLSAQEDDVEATLAVLANDTDADGNELTIIQVGSPSQGGTVTIAADGKSLLYTPASDFAGQETVSYVVTDGEAIDTALVRVTVTAVNDPPVAVDDPESGTLSVSKDSSAQTIDVLGNDTDPEGDPLTVTAVTQGTQGGTVTLVNGEVRYAPATGFSGTETFTYTISDGTSERTATVRIEVSDFAPASLAGTAYLDQNGSGAFDAGDLPIAGVTITLTGTTTDDQEVTRTLATDANGNYTFENLAPGTYRLAQSQPDGMVDGPETVGSQGGSIEANDVIFTELGEGVDGTGNDFGELGRLPEFYTIHDLFYSSSRTNVIVSVNRGTGDVVAWLEGNWASPVVPEVSFDEATGILSLQVVEENGDDEEPTVLFETTVDLNALPANQRLAEDGDLLYVRMFPTVNDLAELTRAAQPGESDSLATFLGRRDFLGSL